MTTPQVDIATVTLAHRANVARIQQLANDADKLKAQFADDGDKVSAAHYAGMRDGLLRAITVLEGRG